LGILEHCFNVALVFDHFVLPGIHLVLLNIDLVTPSQEKFPDGLEASACNSPPGWKREIT
jgi:hypothetical protein